MTMEPSDTTITPVLETPSTTSGEPPQESTTHSDGLLTGQAPDNSSWLSGLDPELKEHPSLTKFKDVEALAKSYVNAQAMIGREKVVLPKEGASKEELDEFYTRLGRPTHSDGYGFAKPSDWPEDYGFDEEAAKEASGVFHEAGLTKAQADKLFQWYNQWSLTRAQGIAEVTSKQNESWTNEIKGKWGQAFDQNVGVANQGLMAISPSGRLAQVLQDSGYSSDPTLVQELLEFGKGLQEDRTISGDRPGMYRKTPDEAKIEKEALLADPEFMKKHNNSSNRKEQEWARKKIQELNAFIYPEEA